MPVDSPARWSLRVGRIGGVELRLHALLAAWLALVLVRIIAGPLVGDPGPRSAPLLVLEAIAVLVAAGLHETGRLVVAARRDALPLSVNLWPLGALDDLPAHAEWRTRVRAVAGGLGALLIAGVLVGLGLLAATGRVAGVVVPLPLGTLEPGMLVLRDGSQPSWLLVLHEVQRGLLTVMAVNLIPVAPLSGGRFVEAVLMRARGRAAARRIAVQVWLVGACILLLVSLALGAWLGVLAAVVGGVGAAAIIVREQAGDRDRAADPPVGRPATEAFGAASRGPDLPLAPGRARPAGGGAGGRKDAADLVEQLLRDVDAHREESVGRGDEPASPPADRGPAGADRPPRTGSGDAIPADGPPRPRDAGGPPVPGGDDAERDAEIAPDPDPDDERAERRAEPVHRESVADDDPVAESATEDGALDAVLAKIARSGMDSLDPRDRAILERETARRNGG